MRITRILIHSMALTFINVLAILAGFAVYSMDRSHDQILIQVPSAIVFTVLGYAVFVAFIYHQFPSWFRIQTIQETGWVLIGSLLWLPGILYPLHYMTQGYVMEFSNVTATWMFQTPLNASILMAAFYFNCTKDSYV